MVTTIPWSVAESIGSGAWAHLAAISILLLVGLLAQKEIAGGLQERGTERLSSALNIGLLPLIVVFFATILVKVFEVLR